MPGFEKFKNDKKLRVIMTARDEESINYIAERGFWPLIKKVEPSDKIHSRYIVLQHKETGEIKSFMQVGDSSFIDRMKDDYEVVIDWTSYYPYNFKSPFAAYMIPKDIIVGERVFVQDLIEDYIGKTLVMRSTYRLRSCEAIWDGKDLKIQYNPNSMGSIVFG